MKRHYIFSLLGALIMLSACNSKEEPESIDEQVAQSVAVTKFTLKANPTVLPNLDSVFFSIDLAHKVIYNADSLPVGTKIDKLVPLITYSNTVSVAEITMTGGETRTGTVNYKSNPSDSIDFTGKVTLRLATDDASVSDTYTIKVNVHKWVGDSLMWDKEAVASLPSRKSNPAAQKTVNYANQIVTLIKESDGGYTLSQANEPAGNWQKREISFPFTPQIRTLTSSDNALFMLDVEGKLYKSSDGLQWSETGTKWVNIIGDYSGKLLGIIESSNSPEFDIYPRPAGFSPALLPPDFPTEDLSSFNSISSKWASEPIGFFIGGSRDGRSSADTWAYDGVNWSKISNTNPPALRNAVVVPYFSYLKTTTSWIQTEYSVWLCMGGRLEDDSVNPILYISYDNGVNWNKASDLMQYPAFVRPGYSADAIVATTPMLSDLDANWKDISVAPASAQMRLKYEIDGNDISWNCPYIYLFGGYNASNVLSNEIRRAVLARLTFTPIF